MRNLLLAAALLSIIATAVVAAETTLTATAVVCTGVKDRAPIGAAENFAASVGQLTCFCELHGVKDKVVHVWFHGDKEVASIELPVRAERWRTWSVKKIPAAWTGPWRVEVRDASGTVLATAKFTVE
jgi:hypothetical protein